MGKPSNKGMSTLPSIRSISCDNSNEGNGREKELFNDDVEPNIQIEEPLSSSITLTDVTSDSNSPEEELQPSSGLPDKSNTDATTTSPIETLPDNAI